MSDERLAQWKLWLEFAKIVGVPALMFIAAGWFWSTVELKRAEYENTVALRAADRDDKRVENETIRTSAFVSMTEAVTSEMATNSDRMTEVLSFTQSVQNDHAQASDERAIIIQSLKVVVEHLSDEGPAKNAPTTPDPGGT